MSDQPRWISKRALLMVHEESLAEFGGARGLRDEGLLDSALARPQNLFAYLPESSMAEYAASYGFGVAKNHPFVDGNKRAAYLCMGIFMAINGYQLRPNQVDAIQTMLSLAAGDLEESQLSAWITANMLTAQKMPHSSE